MAAGPGPLPGQISASVPPFVPRVAAAPNPVGNSTQPSGSAMAIAPPLGGFVVPQPWQASLYPDPSMAVSCDLNNRNQSLQLSFKFSCFWLFYYSFGEKTSPGDNGKT